MTGKLDLLWIGTKNRIRSFVENFKTEEVGAAEIVAILLIIVVVVGVAAVFKEQLGKGVEATLKKFTDFVGVGNGEQQTP